MRLIQSKVAGTESEAGRGPSRSRWALVLFVLALSGCKSESACIADLSAEIDAAESRIEAVAALAHPDSFIDRSSMINDLSVRISGARIDLIRLESSKTSACDYEVEGFQLRKF